MKQGFTLIETLLYSAILAVFLVGTLAFVNGVFSSSNTLLERNEVFASQEFIERKIEWVLGNVSQIQMPALNTTTTQLQALLNDASTTLFSVASGTLQLSTNGGIAIPLHGGRVTANNFSVRNIATSSPAQIIISFSLVSVALPAVTASSTFFYVLPK